MGKYSKIIATKRCFVPTCNNSSTRTPKKDFFYVPEDNIEGWCRAVGYKGPVKYGMKICEDHLNLETDLVNYIWWKTMGGNGKLTSEPPSLKNIEKMTSSTSTVITIRTADTAPTIATVAVSTVSCTLCKEKIAGFQYVCVQCEGFRMCGSCQPESHSMHYLLRAPRDRQENEINKLVREIRNLFSNDEFLPTEYITSSDNEKTLNNEEDYTEIEILEDDEISELGSTQITNVSASENDDDDNSDDGEDSGDMYEHSTSEDRTLTDDERECNRKKILLKNDGTQQVYLVRSSGNFIPKRRKILPDEIWIQHQGRQSKIDKDATKALISIVHSKKYQDMFKVGDKKKKIWEKIGKEMTNLRFEFGKRDPAIVCAQKWRNLERKAKIQFSETV